eukprot:250523_1
MTSNTNHNKSQAAAFFKWIVESDWIDLEQTHTINLFDPKERMDLKETAQYDTEVHGVKQMVIDHLAQLSDEQIKDNAFWMNDLASRLQNTDMFVDPDTVLDSGATVLTDVTQILIPRFADSEHDTDRTFRLEIYGNENRVFLPIFKTEITFSKDGNKIKLRIEDRNLDAYLWKAFIQFFGCYSSIIHGDRTQITTGVGERGNRHRRTFVKARGLGATLPFYLRSIIEYIKNQWITLPLECQAVQSVKPSKKYLRENAKMPYRRGKGRNKQSGTEIEFQSIWNGTIDHVKNILSDNYGLTHDILSDSIQCCDAHKVIEWAPGTFANKVSKLMGGKQWLPPTKAMRYLPIFKTWCDEANAIKKRDKMQIFIERKRSVTSSGIATRKRKRKGDSCDDETGEEPTKKRSRN